MSMSEQAGMTDARQDHAGASVSPARALYAGSGATFTILLAIAILWQVRWGTIPDTSWLIIVCERMLSGERLYTQVHEVNPPFSVWLYLPPVAAARILGMAPEILVQAWTYLAALTGIWFSGAIVKRAGFPEKAALFTLGPAFFAVLVIFPGNVFSEREHLGVALFLPLLALHAWRARKDAEAEPGLGIAALAGLCGSILLLIKPYYAVMVLASALLVAAHRRSLKPIFAPEHWVIGGICVTYLAAVILIHPEFLRDVYPLLVDLYAKGGASAHVMTYYGCAWFFLAYLALWAWPVGRFPELAAVALAASAAALLPLFYQAKGWPYHAYPALSLAVAANLCLIALPRTKRRPAGLLSYLAVPPPSLLSLAIMVAFVLNWPTQRPNSAVVAAIRAATFEPTVAIITPDLDTAHPLSRMIGGRFVSAEALDWVGQVAAARYQQTILDGDTIGAAHYQAIMTRYAEGKRQEFERLRPDLIITKIDDGPWTRQLVGHFGFDRILAGYRVLVEWGRLRVYLRNDYVRPDPPPAG
ncbi:hypothetical protein [Mesorhizobium australafricanum]|uniref:Glycosyltransferase RgtA/B/C/D-like domain-containing protein n=1 Tax=Mesorhizobium australafricanum TaxID=3072311 RepID=A0ABU4WXZ0_9HYPH|nr:hypothetical protein [Mesorhizobium sp. VK3E]MDX8440920.1 hypothetical protein [Mesorhizobium sp. VK3E]